MTRNVVLCRRPALPCALWCAQERRALAVRAHTQVCHCVQLHNTGATTMRAPSKIAPRKGVRPGRGSVAAFAGRRSSSDQTREPPKKRRTDAHHPMLPESLVAQLKAPRQKGGGSGGVYVPMARRLDPEEVQAQMDAESSGEDDVSDAFYIELHAAAQKRAEAERGAPPLATAHPLAMCVRIAC